MQKNHSREGVGKNDDFRYPFFAILAVLGSLQDPKTWVHLGPFFVVFRAGGLFFLTEGLFGRFVRIFDVFVAILWEFLDFFGNLFLRFAGGFSAGF